MTSRNTLFLLGTGAACGALLLTGACSGGGGGSSSSFEIRTTSQSVAASTPLVIAGKNLAFLADEATTGTTGTDFNGDMDKIDSIAVVVDLNTNQQTVLNVAAQELVWISNELYLVTDEGLDDFDWNTDLDTDDLVLLHWSAAAGSVAHIDDLVAGADRHFVVRGTNLFYATATVPVGALASNIEVISAATPLVHTPIPTTDVVGPLVFEILHQEEGLIFLGIDESDPTVARSVNGDGDTTDARVLALLDGTNALGVIRNTELALSSTEDLVVRARSSGSHDWDVGFLVSEADQDATNFNDPALFSASWKPTQCIGDEDADATDLVLHFLDFAGWNTAPLTSPPRNSGLVGGRRIAIANGFIATISLESDEGTCDLNQDGDTTDNVVRWTQLTAGAILPLNNPDDLRALQDVPGGTRGLAVLDGRFVILVSEANDEVDVDGGGLTHNLLAWLEPTTTPHAWDFTHGSGNNTFVGATWMAETTDRSRLCVALPENIAGQNINLHVPAVPGEDTDTNDSVPTFADFSSATSLIFPGVAVAVDLDNAGITIGKNVVFYRVSEADDRRDWNGDADETDFILMRTSLSQARTDAMGVLNNITLGGESTFAVTFDTAATPQGAAYVLDEAIRGVDVNADGTLSFVVQFFRY